MILTYGFPFNMSHNINLYHLIPNNRNELSHEEEILIPWTVLVVYFQLDVHLGKSVAAA